MRTSLVVGIISLLLERVHFVIFVIYENHISKKNTNPLYLNKVQETLFILILLFLSIFVICFIINFKNMTILIQKIFKVIFKA